MTHNCPFPLLGHLKAIKGLREKRTKKEARDHIKTMRMSVFPELKKQSGEFLKFLIMLVMKNSLLKLTDLSFLIF